ncbi:MAG: hypothetical protein FK732_06275 [Asgard group archaeon]|nr:hypothetical protein [Asgard group archaeon]
MTDQVIEYTLREINSYLNGNYQVMVILPMIYLNKIKQPAKEYATFVGNLLSVTWERYKDAPKEEIAKLIGLNYAAAGATEIKFNEDEDGFTVKIENWPNPGFIQAMGTTKKVVNDFHFVWEPIAEFLGFKFEFQTEEIEDLLIFKK